jgi:hypothetical protein
MISIKTYEGFLDFFKSKKKIKVDHRDIIDCFWNIIDDDRIKKSIDSSGNYVDRGIFYEEDDLFKIKTHRDCKIKRISHISFCRNIAIFEFSYTKHTHKDYPPISVKDLIDLIKECEGRLKDLDLKVSYFICWGYDEGACSSKEWKDFESMISRYKHDANITIKIESDSTIII